jgi:hypothetical protein
MRAAGAGGDKAGGQGSIDSLEELQEHEADRVAVGRQAVVPFVRHLLD